MENFKETRWNEEIMAQTPFHKNKIKHKFIKT
jgi:hypothetical protein